MKNKEFLLYPLSLQYIIYTIISTRLELKLNNFKQNVEKFIKCIH